METFCSEDVFVIETFWSGKVFVAEKYCRGDVFITETFCRGDYLKRRRFWNNKQWMANCSTYISCNKKDLIITLRQGRTTPPNNGRKKLKYQLLSNRQISLTICERFYCGKYSIHNDKISILSISFAIKFKYIEEGQLSTSSHFLICCQGCFKGNFTQIFWKEQTQPHMLRKLMCASSFRNISRNQGCGVFGIYHGTIGWVPEYITEKRVGHFHYSITIFIGGKLRSTAKCFFFFRKDRSIKNDVEVKI